MNVSAWSIRNPIAAVMLFVLLTFAGHIQRRLIQRTVIDVYWGCSHRGASRSPSVALAADCATLRRQRLGLLLDLTGYLAND